MTTYYRVSDAELRELTTAQYNALAPSKKADLRVYVVDAQPVTLATETVIDTGVLVGPVEAHRTYGVRNKTASELEEDGLKAEVAQIITVLADIQTQRDVTKAVWDGYTAAQLRAEQWRDRQVLLRMAAILARRIKREAV